MRKSWLILVLVAFLPLTVGVDCDDIGIDDALYVVDALTGYGYGSGYNDGYYNGGYSSGGYYDSGYYDSGYYDSGYYDSGCNCNY